MEKFKLVFLGERLPPHSSLSLEKHLSLLPFSQQSRDKLGSGGAVVLKHSLNLGAAQTLQKKFESMGLVAQLKLQLSPECLKAGMVDGTGVLMAPISRTSQPAKPQLAATQTTSTVAQEGESAVFLLDQQFAKPLVACKKGAYEILDTDNQARIDLETSGYRFGSLFLLGLAVLLGLDLQNYVTIVLAQYTSINLLATVLSVMFLVSAIFVFPKIIQPLSHIKINDLNSARQIDLFDLQTFLISKSKMYWQVGDTGENGEIVIAGGVGELCKSGDTLFAWSSKSTVDLDNRDALKNVQDAVLDDTLIGSFMDAYEHLKIIGAYYLKSKKLVDVDWAAQSGSAVIDSRQNLVAIIYSAPRPAYKIIDQNSADDLVLSAFCIGILKSGLV